MLNWLYTAISWILLRWHDVFSFLQDTTFLGTNWDWILAIIFLVVTIRVVLFPLFVKQIKSQRAMQALQPQVKALQEKHKGDRETLQKEMMELYRREKANPLMGCLPILLQVPVFISLFHVLRRLDPGRSAAVEAGSISVDDSRITLYGWTVDQFQSASLATLFKAPIASQFFDDNFARFDALDTNTLTARIVTGVLTVIMMVTTHLTSKQMILKTGWASDPQQLMIQRLMVYGLPFMLLFSGAFFPLGVILYWVTNNAFSLVQQQWVLRKYPPPPTVNKVPAVAPGTGGNGRSAGKGLVKGAAKGTVGKSTGKGKKGEPGKNGNPPDTPAVDGKQLAPKPGAKPVNPKRVPPKRTPPKNIPPKRKSSTPGKG